MRPHLPGLNALRAIAALAVVAAHLEMTKRDTGRPSALDMPGSWVSDHRIGVMLFFVLSGFIITWLLVREHTATGGIDRRAFYVRRILRIWPVYYGLLLLSAWLYPFGAGWGTWLLCMAGLPNIAKALDIGWTASPQIWSIGVEEQFYLIWPWVLPYLRPRWVLPALLAFFVGWTLLPHAVDSSLVALPIDSGWRRVWYLFFYGAKFNAMALGCMAGYVFATQHVVLRWLLHPAVVVGAAVLTFGLWFSGTVLPVFHDELFALLFALVVLHAASGLYPAFLNHGPLDFLGRISYGMYMYHWIVLLAVMPALDTTLDRLHYDLLLYAGVLGATIVLAWLSYIGPERYFLRLKSRYERG